MAPRKKSKFLKRYAAKIIKIRVSTAKRVSKYRIKRTKSQSDIYNAGNGRPNVGMRTKKCATSAEYEWFGATSSTYIANKAVNKCREK